jgi:purine-binding chemotaxis protein CheW
MASGVRTWHDHILPAGVPAVLQAGRNGSDVLLRGWKREREETRAMTPSSATNADLRTKLVLFQLEGRDHALPVEQIVEIVRMVEITPVPESPDWLAGVINVRGRVIPVMDLRRRLAFEPETPGLRTPIIVAETDGRMIGLIADFVSEMLSLPPQAIEVAEEHGDSPISAMAQAGERLIVILDLSRLCSDTDGLVFARNQGDDEG